MARATPTVLASETEGAVSVPVIFVGDIRITRPHALCFHVSSRCSALICSFSCTLSLLFSRVAPHCALGRDSTIEHVQGPDEGNGTRRRRQE